MNQNLYKQVVDSSPLGYAYHEILCNTQGVPSDYRFLEVNSSFERITGLRAIDIIGNLVTNVLPTIKEGEFDWIGTYGEIALNGGVIEFRQFSEPLGRWFQVKAYSTGKNYFITQFSEISDEMTQLADMQQLSAIAERFLATASWAMDFQEETEGLRILMGAKFVAFHRYIPEKCAFNLYAISGDAHTIEQATHRLEFNTSTNIWEFGTCAILAMENSNILMFSSFSALVDEKISQNHANELEQELGISEVVLVRIGTATQPLGFFTLFMAQGKRFMKNQIMEIFSRQFGIALSQQTAQNHLKKELDFSHALIESLPGYLYVYDERGRLLRWNKKHEEMTGYSYEELSTMSMDRWYEGQDLQRVLAAVDTVFDSGYGTVEAHLIRKDGGKTFVRSNGVRFSIDGNQFFVGIGTDITEHKRLEQELANERELLRTTLLSVGDGVISTDLNGKIVYINRIAEQLTGWTQKDAIGKPIQQVFNIMNEHSRVPSENVVKQVLESRKIIELANHTVLTARDGREFPIEDSAAPILKEDGEISGVVLVFRDFTEKKKKKEEILYVSYHDYLTGLYNRRYFEEWLDCHDQSDLVPISLMMTDLNGLKLVNDAFGYQAGDELLRNTAEILQQESGKDAIVARIGGDEFVILLPGMAEHDANAILKNIKQRISSYTYENGVLSLSIGIGCKVDVDEDLRKIYAKVESDMVRQKLYESTSLRSRTIGLITSALFEKSHREMKHSSRVGEICKIIASRMAFSDEAINRMQIAGLMHDIGKIGVPEHILNKTDYLNPLEWEKMRRHPEIGYRILLSTPEFSEVAEYILAHHEHWDGSGYPRGLKGEAIPLESRIIALADSLDAMTTDRPYKKGLDRQSAIAEIQRCSGTQFDPSIVSVLLIAGLPELI